MHKLHTWMQCKEEAKRGVSRTTRYGERALELLTQQCAKSVRQSSWLCQEAGRRGMEVV